MAERKVHMLKEPQYPFRGILCRPSAQKGMGAFIWQNVTCKHCLKLKAKAKRLRGKEQG
jgi:hypothetical protein